MIAKEAIIEASENNPIVACTVASVEAAKAVNSLLRICPKVTKIPSLAVMEDYITSPDEETDMDSFGWFWQSWAQINLIHTIIISACMGKKIQQNVESV